MFNTVVIHAGPEKAAVLRALVASTGQLQVLREFTAAPSPYEISRMLNTMSPDVVLIDFGLGQQALEYAARISDFAPQTALVGFDATPDLAMRAKQVGFHSLVAAHGGTEDLQHAIHEAMHCRDGGVEPTLYSFLPSKAGSGASTVVVSAATALAKYYGKRVLVIDADLRSGILAIMLNVEPVGSVQSVLRDGDQLDQFHWVQSVLPVHGVDYLLSSRSLDVALPEWLHYYQLLNFARQHYDAILVDLPELVNPATVEIVRRSAMVFPVCTAEIPSLRLTQHRCTELTRWGVPEERIGILLNRWHRSDPAPAELARIIQKPVLKWFPNDYPAVRAAVAAGSSVSFDTKLGNAFIEFAGRLIHQPAANRQSGLAGRVLGMLGLPAA
jgi:pilus assembly protein CpaE